MARAIVTFHKILAACEAGDPGGWGSFLEDYTPIVFRLFDLYFPSHPAGREGFWQATLGALAANGFERLRGFEHQAEPEFLMDFRAFLFEQGARELNPARDSRQPPPPTAESVSELLKGLPLTHQEVVFFKLCGYSDASLERVLVITPAVAGKGLERLRAGYSSALERQEDRCLWPAAWAGVLRAARNAKTDQCPPLRQFVRIHEGGFSWYDKEPAEQHVSGCVHCLERWCGLRELKDLRREAKPLLSAAREFLSFIPGLKSSKPEKSLLGRLFG